MSQWPEVRLGELAVFRNGLNFNASSRGPGVAVVGIPDFHEKSFVEYDGLEEVQSEVVTADEALLQQGDIVFVRSNGNRDLIGRSLLVREEPPRPTSHSGFTIRLRFTDERANPFFFAYLLRSDTFRRRMSSQGGGTNINNLNQGILSRLEVPLPDQRAQQRIAAILGAYDDLIEVNRRRVAVLEEMARRLFEEWFVRFRFPGQEDVRIVDTPDGPLPEGWEFSKLSDHVKASYGFTQSATDEPVGPKFVRVKDINKSPYISWETVPFAPFDGEKGRYALEPGDLVVGRMADVGKVGLIDREIDAIAASYLVRMRPLVGTHHLFFYFLTSAPSYLQYVTGASTGTTRKSAGLPVLTGFKFALPPTDLINQFVAVAEPIRELGSVLVRSNAELAASRDLLLPRLISGQLSVEAAERELDDAA